MVIDIDRYDLIFSRKWFSQFDILLDYKRRSLVWPDSRKDYIARHELELLKEALQKEEISSIHQADVDQRNKKIDEPPSPLLRKILPRPKKLSLTFRSYDSERRYRNSVINRELTRIDDDEPRPNLPRVNKVQKEKPLTVDLAMISAPAFIRNLKDPTHEFFTTSLYEIDRILEDRNLETPAEEETEEQMLRRTVPKEYYDLIDVFSKTASDELPLHRTYDYKIQLEGDLLIGYSPLYKQTTE